MTRCWCFRVMMIFDYCIDDVDDDENGCDGGVDGHGHDHDGHHRCDHHHGTKFFFSLFYE